jgi:hypothetical protein
VNRGDISSILYFIFVLDMLDAMYTCQVAIETKCFFR